MPGRNPDQSGDYAGNAQQLHDIGTRLFTASVAAAEPDLGQVRDLLQWRDEVNRSSDGASPASDASHDRP